MFMYNYGKVNTLKVTGIAMTYKGKTIYPKNMSEMLVKGNREVVQTAAKPFFEESATNYQLVYRSIVLASARQMFVVDEGYVPSFEKMIWKSWHFGPATASYANGVATVQCPDSLNAHEVWDDGSNRNWLRKTTTSKNIFSVAVSGTEVDDINAVIGKSLTVNGDKASVAEFTVTVNRTSKEIVEKSVPYTYNGKSINFVDSLHACGYKLKGGQVISKSQVRVDMVREGATETVSFNLPVTITEKEKPHDPDFEGKIVFGYATDSYVDGTNMATWEGCYLHFGVLYNGTYKVYSRKVGTNDAWRETSVSADYVSNVSDSKPAAFIGNTAGDGYYLGYTKWWDQGSWCKIAYFTLGRETNPERYLSSFNSTIKGENPNSYRMPLRGKWSKNKITVQVTDTETVTYTITGSED
jgi:hypothetical protein